MNKMKSLYGRLMSALTVFAMLSCLFPSAALAATVSTAFTTHSLASSPLLVFGTESFTYAVSGTFVGTVKLQKSVDGSAYQNFLVITSSYSTNPALTGTVYVDEAPGRRAWYRVYVSTHSSGTIVTSLADVNDMAQEFYNKKGAANLTLNDDGVSVPGTLAVVGDMTPSGRLVLAKTAVGSAGTAAAGVYLSTTIPATSPYESIVSSSPNAGSMTSTPTIATVTVVGGGTNLTDGTVLTVFSTSSVVLRLVDNDTLSGSLLELGAPNRPISASNSVTLIFDGIRGKWYELFYSTH